MNPTLEDALIEAYATAPAGVAHVATIELRSSRMSDSLYLVQGFFHREMRLETGTLKTFRACAFDFKLPATDEGGLQEMTITMDNAGNRVSDFCKAAALSPTPVEIWFRPYLSTDLETPLMDPPLRLFLKDITISEAQVSGRADPVDFLNLKFPTQLYTSDRFPDL